jgi:hypothetical protein
VLTLGDAHLYLNHIEQAKEQLSRSPRALPVLRINPTVTDLFAFSYDDFLIEGYDPHPAIKAPDRGLGHAPLARGRDVAQSRDRPRQPAAVAAARRPGVLQAGDHGTSGDHGTAHV